MIDWLLETHANEITMVLELAEKAAPSPIGPQWTRDHVLSELKVARGFGYWDRGGLAAFVLFREIGEIWEIVQLATHPQQQRRGLMSQLLSHMLWNLPKNGQVWLEVHVRNEPARRMYEKLGFRQVGNRPRYYADGGEAILYSFG